MIVGTSRNSSMGMCHTRCKSVLSFLQLYIEPQFLAGCEAYPTMLSPGTWHHSSTTSTASQASLLDPVLRWRSSGDLQPQRRKIPPCSSLTETGPLHSTSKDHPPTCIVGVPKQGSAASRSSALSSVSTSSATAYSPTTSLHVFFKSSQTVGTFGRLTKRSCENLRLRFIKTF